MDHINDVKLDSSASPLLQGNQRSQDKITNLQETIDNITNCSLDVLLDIALNKLPQITGNAGNFPPPSTEEKKNYSIPPEVRNNSVTGTKQTTEQINSGGPGPNGILKNDFVAALGKNESVRETNPSVAQIIEERKLQKYSNKWDQNSSNKDLKSFNDNLGMLNKMILNKKDISDDAVLKFLIEKDLRLVGGFIKSGSSSTAVGLMDNRPGVWNDFKAIQPKMEEWKENVKKRDLNSNVKILNEIIMNKEDISDNVVLLFLRKNNISPEGGLVKGGFGKMLGAARPAVYKSFIGSEAKPTSPPPPLLFQLQQPKLCRKFR